MNEVDALETKEQIMLVTTFLDKHYSSTVVDVWRIGLQVALRISDLLRLEYSHLRTRDGIHTIKLKEGKTGKMKTIKLNEKAYKLFMARKRANKECKYVFQSTSSNMSKKDPKPVSREHVGRALKEAGEQPALNMTLSTHTMRKTRGRAVYLHTNDIALVMKLLNHSSIESTLRYIGITQDKLNETYDLVL